MHRPDISHHQTARRGHIALRATTSFLIVKWSSTKKSESYMIDKGKFHKRTSTTSALASKGNILGDSWETLGRLLGDYWETLGRLLRALEHNGTDRQTD